MGVWVQECVSVCVSDSQQPTNKPAGQPAGIQPASRVVSAHLPARSTPQPASQRLTYDG